MPLPVGSTQVLPSGRGGYQQGGYQQTGVLAYSDGTGPIPVTKGRSAGRVALWVVLGLAVVGVFVLLFWLGRSLFSATATSVQVPNLVGIQITAVDTTLKNNNLTVGLATNANSDKPKGEVIDQDPRAGQPVQPGSLVNVTVSAGKEQVSVPILVGLSKDAAIAALQRASLNPGKITEKDSDRPAGQVLSVNPAEGQNVDSGSSVTLVVSTGKVPVPNVVTETEAQARSDLANAGFNPNVVQQVSDKTPGIVLAQSPLAGVKLVQGSLVTITVAVAAPTTASPPPTTTAPPTSAPPTSPPPTSPPPTSAPPTSPPPTSPSVSRPPSSTATP